MYPAQSGYQAPQFHPGATHHHAGPPPAKKVKGNPIITKYPPPPGYVPPQQVQAQFQQPGYPQPGYQGHHAPHHGTPQTYQQSQHPGYSPQQHPAAGHPQATPQYPSQGYPAPPGGWQQPVPPPQSAPPQAFQLPSNHGRTNSRRHNSAPFVGAKVEPVEMLDGNGDPFAPEDLPARAPDDLEDDFWSESYYARHYDEINPDLSIGVIVWQPPAPTRRALASTFDEVELEALAPRVPQPGDDESVSGYFIGDKKEDAFVSVKLTRFWDEIKGDSIFKEFPAIGEKHLSFSELLDAYHDRPDPRWYVDRSVSVTPVPSIENDHQHDSAMDLDAYQTGVKRDRSESVTQPSRFERALMTREKDYHSARNRRSHSRATSVVSSQAGQKITRPVPLPAVRDESQEDILAMLGVTGSPQTVYQTPGPALGAPPGARTREGSAVSSRQPSMGSIHEETSRVPPPPPPPPMHQHPSYRNSWNHQGEYHRHSRQSSRPLSSHSQHDPTAATFYPQDNDATPRAKTHRTSDYNRKRSLDQSDDDYNETPRRQEDDVTPRQQRKKLRPPHVDEAYGRRW